MCLITSICALTPISASAAASGTCGEHLTWTLDNEGVLTISGEGEMFYYNCFYGYHSTIKTVIIKDGVTSIGVSAFCSCSSLTSITIPDSVTSIGRETFFGCDSLETIYYTGSEPDWKKFNDLIDPLDFNNFANVTTIHYNAKPNDNTA